MSNRTDGIYNSSSNIPVIARLPSALKWTPSKYMLDIQFFIFRRFQYIIVEWDFNSRFKCWLNWHTIKLYLPTGTLYVDLRPVSCKTVIIWILYLPFHDDSMDKSRNTISSVKPLQLFWYKSFPPAWKTKWCGRISEITLSHRVQYSVLFTLPPLIPWKRTKGSLPNEKFLVEQLELTYVLNLFTCELPIINTRVMMLIVNKV